MQTDMFVPTLFPTFLSHFSPQYLFNDKLLLKSNIKLKEQSYLGETYNRKQNVVAA